MAADETTARQAAHAVSMHHTFWDDPAEEARHAAGGSPWLDPALTACTALTEPLDLGLRPHTIGPYGDVRTEKYHW